MGDMLSGLGTSIATTFNKNPTGVALAGAGTLENFIAQQKRNQILSQYENLVNNPAAAEAKIQSLTAPLNQGLVQSVENETQGYLGERGLAESPQISESVLSQSLAPYIQQNQQEGVQQYETYLQQLLGAANSGLLPGNVNMAQLIASLQGKPGTTPTTSPTGLSLPLGGGWDEYYPGIGSGPDTSTEPLFDLESMPFLGDYAETGVSL